MCEQYMCSGVAKVMASKDRTLPVAWSALVPLAEQILRSQQECLDLVHGNANSESKTGLDHLSLELIGDDPFDVHAQDRR